jgi:hypothetical protein
VRRSYIGTSCLERASARLLMTAYKRQLQAIVKVVPTWVSEEILSASEHIWYDKGRVVDESERSVAKVIVGLPTATDISQKLVVWSGCTEQAQERNAQRRRNLQGQQDD